MRILYKLGGLKRRLLGLTLFIIILGGVINTQAKDLGKVGTSFVIEEESFTAMMKRKLADIDIEEHNKKMKQIAIDRVNEPQAVSGISKAIKNNSFYYDPTYTLEKDAVLPCGKVLYKAGTRVNPLEHMDLERRLIFIDSRDKSQVEWLIERLDRKSSIDPRTDSIEDRVILVGGSVLKLKEEVRNEHADKIYFDQNGEFVKRLNISAVPAIAIQDGISIRIEEVKIDD